MKTIEQIREAIAGEKIEACFPDGRNVSRLIPFFPVSEWDALGYKTTDETDASKYPVALTAELVREKMAGDLEFGFEKALNKRGLSAPAQYQCVKTWLWVLEDDLANWDDDNYAQYGLPFFKAVAVKFGLPNPIGDDAGNEYKYSAESD